MTVSSLSSSFPVFPAFSRDNLVSRAPAQRESQAGQGDELRVEAVDSSAATEFIIEPDPVQVTQVLRDSAGDTNANFEGLPLDKRNALQTYLETASTGLDSATKAQLVVGVDTFA